MIHTGVQSTGSRRSARRRRSLASGALTRGVLTEQLRDRRLDLLGGRARIGCVADGTPDDDVVGAVAEGLRDVDDALLIVARAVVHRTDPRCHDDEALVDLGAQLRYLE